jgi:hypothetical protein
MERSRIQEIQIPGLHPGYEDQDLAPGDTGDDEKMMKRRNRLGASG